jgi:hypothetical protein
MSAVSVDFFNSNLKKNKNSPWRELLIYWCGICNDLGYLREKRALK